MVKTKNHCYNGKHRGDLLEPKQKFVSSEKGIWTPEGPSCLISIHFHLLFSTQFLQVLGSYFRYSTNKRILKMEKDKLIDYDRWRRGEEVCLCSLGVMPLCRKSKAVVIAKKTHWPGQGQCRQSRWQIRHSLASKNWALGKRHPVSCHWACTTDMLINYASIVTIDGYDYTDGNSGGNERGSW